MVAVGGVIQRNGRLLIGRRLEDDTFGGLWEFPGGKIEPGESPEDCLRRELMEELGVSAEIGARICVVEPNEGFKLIAHRAVIVEGEPELREHSRLEWVLPGELSGYDMLPADGPVVEMLLDVDRAEAG